MSRRKQLKPQPVKDDASQSSNDNDDGGCFKKKRLLSEASEVKSEPPSCDEEDKSISSVNNDIRLECQFCGAGFDSVSDLQTHTLRDHLPMPVPALECQHCFASLPSFAAFVMHMRGHLNDRDETCRCSRCPLSFNDPQARLIHLVSHFEVRKPMRYCTECGASYGDTASFNHHFIEQHLRLQHLCTVCGETFESQKEFNEHVLTHSNETLSLECGQCRIAFETRELLAMHVQLVHDREQSFLKVDGALSSAKNGLSMGRCAPKEIRVLHCSVCDVKCYGEDALDEHRLFTHCKVPRSDVCANCSGVLKTVEDFEKHTRLHRHGLYMTCAVCRQSIRNETQLALHCQFHMQSTEDGEQTCGICSKVLINRLQLNVHLMEHDDRRCCPHCLRTFALAQHLLSHVAEVHNEEQPLHACYQCDESFRFAIQLENHALKHVAEPRTGSNSNPSSPSESFSCQHCSLVFSSSTALLAHLRTHNDTQRRCPLCGLSFNTASRFENHVRKHASTTNCICQICSEGFATRDVLDMHMQIHKGNLELGAHSILS